MQDDIHILLEKIDQLSAEVSELKKMLRSPSASPETTTPNNYYNVPQAAAYLGRSKNTVYQYASRGILPYNKPNGKEILFDKADLDEFLKRNRRKSRTEVSSEVDQFLASKRKKSR